MYSKTRLLLNLPKLLNKYNQTTINIGFKSDRPNSYITIPIEFDLIVRLKAWISYDSATDQLSISQYLIGVDNHWISTLIDDHKNKRIDLNLYTYDDKN